VACGVRPLPSSGPPLPLWSGRSTLIFMATITSQLEAMIADLQDLLKDAEKTDRGQKAAGTRVRKGLQGLKKSADETRKAILALRE